MAGGVDEVEDVGLSIFGGVVHAGRLEFDGDAPFPFQVHVVQELFFHFPLFYGSGVGQQAIGQGGFTVVDVGDDGEVADAGNGYVGHIGVGVAELRMRTQNR